MRKAVLVACLLAPAGALADGEPPGGDDESEGGLRADASLQVASGARALFPYDGEYCGSSGAYCMGRSPFRLDLGAGVGVLPSLDLVFAAQFGVERDFGTSAGAAGPRPLAIAPGLRAHLGETMLGRVESSAQAVLDFAAYEQASGVDVALRNENRLVFELGELGGGAAASGYVFFAETVGWQRWLRFELEGGAGVLARIR